MKGKGVCKAGVIILPTVTVKDNFLLLELGSVDVILGLQWLHRNKLANIDNDFHQRGEPSDYKRDSSLTKVEVSLEMSMKT